MHVTIQKSLDEILKYIKKDEKVFIVGCGNCAEKCHSGGEKEVIEMKKRLENKGITVVGYAATPSGASLCKLSLTKKILNEDHKNEIAMADSFLVLACGQGIHTVMDATDEGIVHPGCNTIFGGETVKDDNYIKEYCSLCGECILEATGGLCPVTLCSKGLLNGPCGGARDGKCEVDRELDCGWELIYKRLKKLNKLDILKDFQKPKNHAVSNKPRSLTIKGNKVEFRSLAGIKTSES